MTHVESLIYPFSTRHVPVKSEHDPFSARCGQVLIRHGSVERQRHPFSARQGQIFTAMVPLQNHDYPPW